jgi:hypothetical protein
VPFSLRFSGTQNAGVQLGEINGVVERLEAQGPFAAPVVDLPAVRLAAEVLDPRLGARDDQDVLERGDCAVVGERALAIVVAVEGERTSTIRTGSAMNGRPVSPA